MYKILDGYPSRGGGPLGTGGGGGGGGAPGAAVAPYGCTCGSYAGYPPGGVGEYADAA